MSSAGAESLSRRGGLDRATIAQRAHELLEVLDLTEAEHALVIDYSARLCGPALAREGKVGGGPRGSDCLPRGPPLWVGGLAP